MGADSKMEQINEEILRRIEIMDDPEYDPGPAMDRKDLIGILTVGAVCIVGMVLGYYA